MARSELQDLVGWTVEDAPPEALVGDVLRTVLSTVATVATLGTTTGAASRPTWALPADPDAFVGIGHVQARGAAPWLPGGPGRRHRVQATRRAVVVSGTDDRRLPTPVPLDDLRVCRARPRGVGRRTRHATAPWTLTLTGAGTVELQGAWLALAWIGLLAGWPEPAGG